MATLQRCDGTSVVYADSDLDSLIAHLIAGNASGTGNGDNVYFMCSPPSLLIMDLNWQINRRFSELFQASTNMNLLFYLQFENDHDYYDLPEALVKCGYAGVLPRDAMDLPIVYMALYESGLVGANKAISIGSGDSLVGFAGTVTEPAQIKGLIGGSGVLLSASATDITIEAQSLLFSSLGAGTPILDPSSTISNIYLNTLQAGAGISRRRCPDLLGSDPELCWDGRHVSPRRSRLHQVPARGTRSRRDVRRKHSHGRSRFNSERVGPESLAVVDSTSFRWYASPYCKPNDHRPAA